MKNENKQSARSDTTSKPKSKNKMDDPNYEAYQKWIKSKGFKQLRELAMERDNYTCQVTGRRLEDLPAKCTLQAHHKKYDNCGKGNEEELADIIILSSSAHRAIHSAKSHLRLFTDKSKVKENIDKFNPKMECLVKEDFKKD